MKGKTPDIKKERLLKSKNLKGFGIFLILSFLFLVLSKLSNTYTENVDFKVYVVGLEDEISMASDTGYVINTTIKSRGFNLLPYVFSNPDPINLNAKTELIKKSNVFMWDAYNNTHKFKNMLGESFDIIAVNPDTLIFTYNRLTSKRVPVSLNTALSYAPGFDLLEAISIEPDSVKIIGAQQIIDTITSVKTRVLTINKLKEDFSETVNIEQPSNVSLITIPNTVKAKGQVRRYTEGIVEAMVVIKNIPDDVRINYFPKTLTLSYYVNLEDYKHITAKDFVVECDFDEISNSQRSYLTARVIKAPKSVKTTKLKQTKVDFIMLE